MLYKSILRFMQFPLVIFLLMALTIQVYAYPASNPDTKKNASDKILLDVSTANVSITYGNDAPTFVPVYSGFVDNDTESVLDVAPTCTVTGFSGVNIYPIVCSGGLDDKYDFNYTDGVLTVLKAQITVNPYSYAIAGGDPDPAKFDFVYQGFVLNEDKTVIDVPPVCGVSGPHTADGTYPITCSGGLDNNYYFFYVDGTLMVTEGARQDMFSSTNLYDGWVLESSENSNQGRSFNSTAASFFVGDDALNRQYRGILSFDISGLPKTAMITKVTLKIRKSGSVGGDPFRTNANSLVADFARPFFNHVGLEAVDFQKPATKIAAGVFGKTAALGWYTANINPALFAGISRYGVIQFRVRFSKDDDNDHIADYLKFYSGNAALTNRPMLIIEYRR